MKRILSLFICIIFLFNNLMPSAYAQALMGSDLAPLPKPGSMVPLSSPVNPPVLRGIKVYVNDPLKFDFILDPGSKSQTQSELKETSSRLLKYFLTTLTVPQDDIWVNLSPYEKNRIIPMSFGQTEMGRDLLGQDYLLKQITASLMFPQGEAGKKFWARVYAEAQQKFGSTQIPVDTFNKVWIMPAKAIVYEKMGDKQATAFVVESRLKVMLESDYIAAQKHGDASAVGAMQNGPLTDAQKISRDVARQIIIPILEKEVNEGANFAPLRQVYSSILLALWYKNRMKGSILSSAYVNRNKIAGVNVEDKAVAQKIWQRYVQAYKKGAFNLISEEKDTATNEIIPRKYFAGGFSIKDLAMSITHDPAQISRRGFLGALFLVMAGCGTGIHSTRVWDFPDITTITIPSTRKSNYWGYTLSSAPGGALVVDINYETTAQPDTKYILNPNGSIQFPNFGINGTYRYDTDQGRNMLSNVINILNFITYLSPENSSELNGLIETIQNTLPSPFIDMKIPDVFNDNWIQEGLTLTPVKESNGDQILQINTQIPDQTLGLGIPDETGTDDINLDPNSPSYQQVTSYTSDVTPFSETFQPGTDDWANVLYWDLLGLQRALTAGQQAGPNQLTATQLQQLQAWYDTINGWYTGYYNAQVQQGRSVDAFSNKAPSQRHFDKRKKELEEKFKDRAMGSMTRRAFIVNAASAAGIASVDLLNPHLLMAQHVFGNNNPFVYEERIIHNGPQEVMVFGLTHPDLTSVENIVKLVENPPLYNNSRRIESANSLRRTLESRRDFISLYGKAIRSIESQIERNPQIHAFGYEGIPLNAKLDVQGKAEIIQKMVRNAVKALFGQDNPDMTDDILLYILPPQVYLALHNQRIGSMPSVGLEDPVLLSQEQQISKKSEGYMSALEAAVVLKNISPDDLLFFRGIYNSQSISHAQQQRIDRIKAKAGIYAKVIDLYISNYFDFLRIAEKRSEALAQNIHAYGKSMVFPVGDFHFSSVVKALEHPKGAFSKPAFFVRVVQARNDQAMNGGIDLRENSTPLDVHNEGRAVNFNIDPAQVERIMAAPGLIPEVFAIKPLQSLPSFLGMSPEEAQHLT